MEVPDAQGFPTPKLGVVVPAALWGNLIALRSRQPALPPTKAQMRPAQGSTEGSPAAPRAESTGLPQGSLQLQVQLSPEILRDFWSVCFQA